jgi:type I restriction enzyme, S subunit
MLRKGDLLFNRTNSLALVGKVGIVAKDFKDITFASYLIRLRLKPNYISKYYCYLLNSEHFIRYLQSNAIQTANQANISSSRLKQIKVLAISSSIQRTIVDYLDTKTAHIEHKIELLEKKAKKYVDLKKSLINETVKRGLDKNTQVKNSGIDWIGQIPAHWEVKRVYDVAIQQKVKNVGLREKNLLSLSYGKLKRKDIESNFGLLPESFETYQIVNKGNIILRLTDLQNDWTSLRVGLARERGIITSAYLCLRFSKQINPVFAYYVLHTYDLQKVFYWLGSGLRSVMKFEDIKVLPFILPSLEEQNAIANYLEAKTAHIEKIIETIHLEIEKLKELRKTLINDVVTGKIKVYEGAVPE